MPKLLIFGPRYHKSGPVGGIVVSFEILLGELEKAGVSYTIVDTNKKNYSNALVAMLKILWSAVKLIHKVDHVSLHGTAKDYIFIAPFVVFLARALGKKASLRKFAGSFNEVYIESNFISKSLIRYAIKNASVNFFQTHYLVDFFSGFNPNTLWMPTVRLRPARQLADRLFSGCIIFLGHVRKEKGMLELLESANLLRLYKQLKHLQKKTIVILFRMPKRVLINSMQP